MGDEPERLDAPNQQVVGGAPPWEEGTGGGAAEAPPPEPQPEPEPEPEPEPDPAE